MPPGVFDEGCEDSVGGVLLDGLDPSERKVVYDGALYQVEDLIARDNEANLGRAAIGEDPHYPLLGGRRAFLRSRR